MLTNTQTLLRGGPTRRPRSRSLRAAAALALCLTVLPGCGSDGGGGPSGPSGPSDNPTTPRTAVPDELVGQWYSGDVSPTDYYNPNTGHWSGAGYGKGMLYTFTRDGRYEFAFQLASRLDSCYTLTLFYVRGTMTVDEAAGVFQLHPGTAKRIERSNCGGGNGDAAYEDDGESVFYEVHEADDGTLELFTRPTDGSYGWGKLRRVAD